MVGVPDEKWGEIRPGRGRARAGRTVTLDAVRAFADGRLARYKLPTALLVLDALPRSATDKIARARIREHFEKLATEPSGRPS